MPDTLRHLTTPRERDLPLTTIANAAGLTVSVLRNGAILAIEHRAPSGNTMINQLLGSAVHGGAGRIFLRVDGDDPVEILGPSSRTQFGSDGHSLVWQGESLGIRHRVVLRLDPNEPVWFWRIGLEAIGPDARRCDVVLAEDVGLGGRGFLMGSEAYASQYLDHHVERHPAFGPVVMTRQNLSQGGRNPWLALGAIEGARAFSTDAMQLFGPQYRDADRIALRFGQDLRNEVLQHEVAFPALQSNPIELEAGTPAELAFFGLYVPHHPDASSAADLARLDILPTIAARRTTGTDIVLAPPARGLLQDAPALQSLPFTSSELDDLYPARLREEMLAGELASFFTPAEVGNRHVVLAAKEAIVARRHGEILRGGGGLLPDDRTFSATCWMHGVFAAQLTIGNTSFHKLFSVSRDPYNITRASGLRMLVDTGTGWQLLTVPSAFEMGLGDCRWVYRLPDRRLTVSAVAAGDDPAIQFTVTVDGAPCRFLVFGHLVLGERELEQAGGIEIDATRKRIRFTPPSDWLWGQNYPDAAYHLVSSTPEVIDAIGADELLYAEATSASGSHVAFTTLPTERLVFAVTGSMTDRAEAERLADRFAAGVDDADLLSAQDAFWRPLIRVLPRADGDPEREAHDLFMPWLAHDAMIHLTAPHGLEQYTGAAWGTRDVCQGPVEFLLAAGHDGAVEDILRILFAEQSETSGDWPQWFMLPPYSNIRAGESHGDIVIWPLKALCDLLERTGDVALLDEAIAWRTDKTFEPTSRRSSIAEHIDRLVASIRAHFIPGTHLLRYGEGDWNDSLQPHDPALPDRMVSSWTVALLYEQLIRYAAILRRAGRLAASSDLDTLSSAIKTDFSRYLTKDGAVAGYALFDEDYRKVELLLHPSDTRTGLSWSLIAITQAILGGLLDDGEARRHLDLIREHLLFPDGARLLDKPVAYRGGPERLFKRAESSSFFGREIGLMYSHAHVRYAEALARFGMADELRRALALVNPILVTETIGNASPRQRNTYFSSSDAAFKTRIEASTEWDRVAAGTVPVDGGWRIYSSGPGILTRLIVNTLITPKK